MTGSVAQRLAEIRERAEKATPGPWRSGIPGNFCVYAPDGMAERSGPLALMRGTREDQASNRAFIAHARADIPYLLTQLAERERMLAEADAVIWELSNGDITDADEDPRFVGALARHRERQNG